MECGIDGAGRGANDPAEPADQGRRGAAERGDDGRPPLQRGIQGKDRLGRDGRALPGCSFPAPGVEAHLLEGFV